MSTEVVTLRGGLTVSLDALRVLWALEDRGLRIRRGADGRILIGPPRSLRTEDRAHIDRHREELAALISYEPPEAGRA